jgi:hypothetical protein
MTNLTRVKFGYTTRLVFSNKRYVALGILVTASFWVLLNILDQVIFLSPIVTFYLPSYSFTGFVISNITAGLVGFVVPMNIYVLRQKKLKLGTSVVSGSIGGVIPSVCASCSSIGLFLASTFGTAGATASAFLTNYDIPLRLVAIGVLVYACYSVSRKLTFSCTLPSEK